jgi:hypothetical protein
MDDAIACEAFRDALNALKPGWEITERGIVGPGQAIVRLGQRHESGSDGHVDVQFVLDEDSPAGEQLWDCVSGFGATQVDKARSAAYLWSRTTAGAMFELKYSRRGEFADHYRGAEPGGLRGWHVICGAIAGFGKGDSADRLVEWWIENPVLPALSLALSDSIDEPACPHGLKILFGGDRIAEVRLDGERHEAASVILENLAWPTLQPPGFARSYVLVLHRDGE